MKNFTGGVQRAFRRRYKASEGLVELKFPVSIRLCQTNPHIDKVKTL
jgi:hypothetical protein